MSAIDGTKTALRPLAPRTRRECAQVRFRACNQVAEHFFTMAQRETKLFQSMVDPEVATIEDHPALLVVFGGQVGSPSERIAGIPPKTQRDAFVHWTESHRGDLVSRMLLPENFPDWSEYDTYHNLLQFEEDLGHLTGAVLIFVEAPGAIAELGAFTQMPSLRDRLAVVVKDKYHPAKSFISLGPLRYLEHLDQESVCAVEDTDALSFSTQMPHVMSAIDHTMAKLKPKQSFDIANKGHHLLLALDLITTLGVVDFPTVNELLAYFTVPTRESRVRQMLFALTKAQLIKTGKLGGKYWYWPVYRNQRWVGYRGKGGTVFNRPRLISKVYRHRSSSDLAAHRAYEWAARGGPK